MSPVPIAHWIRDCAGMDRAIGASTATQLLRFITGPITMVLILKYLSPETQGYYYSFGAVMGIQVFLEAGFAVSISQFVAKEFAGLRFNKNDLLKGSSVNLSRLRSIYQKALKYYCAMACLLVVGLGFGGYAFFSAQADYGVPWQVPWMIASLCVGINFLLTPFWAVLEGCNRVADVALYRLGLTCAGFLTSALGIIITQSIWVAVWTSIAGLLVAWIYIFCRWFRFLKQLHRPYAKEFQINWRREIWGFQWRIAGTWGGRYFLEAGLPAIAFQFFGAVPAGKIGMSFQLTRMVAAIASSWTVTKIPLWGSLTAKKQFDVLQKSWNSAALRHIVISFMGQVALLGMVVGANYVFPEESARLLSPAVFAGFSIGWFMYSFWLVSMHYTRAHRLEPFVRAHLTMAVAFILFLLLTKDALGVASIPFGFAILHLPVAVWSWTVARRLQQNSLLQPAMNS